MLVIKLVTGEMSSSAVTNRQALPALVFQMHVPGRVTYMRPGYYIVVYIALGLTR